MSTLGFLPKTIQYMSTASTMIALPSHDAVSVCVSPSPLPRWPTAESAALSSALLPGTVPPAAGDLHHEGGKSERERERWGGTTLDSNITLLYMQLRVYCTLSCMHGSVHKQETDI